MKTHENTPSPGALRATPRTDAACGFFDMETAVDADFARELERELAEMTARAVSLVMHLPPETLAGDVQRWRDEVIAMSIARESEVRELLRVVKAYIFATESADETGYVTDIGFIDLPELSAIIHAAIARYEGKVL